jgi:Uma2 family endonuclease
MRREGWCFFPNRGRAKHGDRNSVRIPDVAFISWERLPEGELPDEPIASRVPELAVKVLSKSNTPKEIALKREEYFRAGVKLVWVIDPKTQTAEEYTSATASKHIGKTHALDGRDVLPGLTVPLKQLFARMKRRGRQ